MSTTKGSRNYIAEKPQGSLIFLKISQAALFWWDTAHWGGFSSVLDPIAFQKRDWVNLSGWPLPRPICCLFMRVAHDNLDRQFRLQRRQLGKKDPIFVPLH